MKKIHLVAPMLSLSLACLAGCANPGPEGQDADTAAQTIMITGQDTADLDRGEELRYPLRLDLAYEFDPSEGPIAYDQVTLVLDDGQELHVEDMVATMAQREGVSAEGFTPEAFTIRVDRPAAGAHEPGLQTAKLATSVCWIINSDWDGGMLYFPYPCITGSP